MAMTLFYTFACALAVSVALTPPLMRLAGHVLAVDLPGARKVHTMPIARTGGIAFALATLLSLVIWVPRTEMVVAYLAGAIILVAFGAWDDRADLDYRVKFLAQLAAAVVVVAYGGVSLDILPFLEATVLPGWVTGPLTIVALLGVTNAVNLSDGLDGLAGGLSLLTFGGVAYLAHLSGDGLILVMAIALAGGVFGFLRFNTHPARVFMGDAGSQFLGFSAAVLSIALTQSPTAAYSPALAPLLLGVPLLDTIGVMIQRLRERRSPFRADRNHIHHKLLSAGLAHHEAVVAIYVVQSVMIGLAYLLRHEPDLVALAVYAAFAVPILNLFVSRRAYRLRRAGADRSSVAGEDRPVIPARAREIPVLALGVGVPLFLVAAVFVPGDVPVDFGIVALPLMALLLIALGTLRRAAPLLVRLGLYVGGAFAVYLSERAPGVTGWPVERMLNGFFLAVAILIVLAVGPGRERRFEITPLDYLVAFAAVVVPNLLQLEGGDVTLGTLAAKVVVMFFACELLVNRLPDRLPQLGLVAALALLGLGVRAWRT